MRFLDLVERDHRIRLRRTCSVNWPPSSYPTYPGGDPTSRETVNFSMYASCPLDGDLESPNICSASVLASASFRTRRPEQCERSNRRLGSFRSPARDLRRALQKRAHRLGLADEHMVSSSSSTGASGLRLAPCVSGGCPPLATTWRMCLVNLDPFSSRVARQEFKSTPSSLGLLFLVPHRGSASKSCSLNRASLRV